MNKMHDLWYANKFFATSQLGSEAGNRAFACRMGAVKADLMMKKEYARLDCRLLDWF
jgi:hypothetical protein